MIKSETDLHWNERALNEKNEALVNFHDPVQRNLETDFVFRHLPASGKVLEVGCGNGYLTSQLRERCERVDGFDFAENMIERARATYGETNNSFFHASLLDPEAARGNTYRCIVCVRVLINLRDLEQQRTAVANMANWLEPGGRLLLVEGYSDGFAEINRLRESAGLPAVVPATINYYSALGELWPTIAASFDKVDEFHTGMYDFLTRVVYPQLVGADRIESVGDFHRAVLPIARLYNPADMAPLARLRGFALARRQS
jgi:SAM-dependent methyltransferase